MKMYMKKCQSKHEIAFFQWRDMFVPEANRDELKEGFQNRVNTAKKLNPKLCQMTANMENKGANLTALNQAKTVNKMGKDLNLRMKTVPTKKKSLSSAKLTSQPSPFQAHLINHLSEIGWLHPLKSEPVEDGKGMVHAQFDVLAYDQSKYLKDYPPLMIYLPNDQVFMAMVHACLLTKKSGMVDLEGVMEHFVPEFAAM